MKLWLLTTAADESDAGATRLEINESSGPGDPAIELFWSPVTQHEDLLETARQAAGLALRILRREWGARGRLAVTFTLDANTNITGRSAGLLLTIAIVTRFLYSRGDRRTFPSIAATGDIGGNSRSASTGAVGAVGGVGQKIAAAIAAAGDEPTLIFFPTQQAAEVRAPPNTSAPHLRLIPIAHVDEALAALDIPLRRTWLRGSGPFRGLECFEYEHHAIFYGRD